MTGQEANPENHRRPVLDTGQGFLLGTVRKKSLIPHQVRDDEEGGARLTVNLSYLAQIPLLPTNDRPKLPRPPTPDARITPDLSSPRTVFHVFHAPVTFQPTE